MRQILVIYDSLIGIKLPKMGNKNMRRAEVMNVCRVISEHVRGLSATKFPAEPEVRMLI